MNNDTGGIFMVWVDVEARLPENDGWYICTVDVHGQQRYVMDLYFKASTQKWLDNRRCGDTSLYDRTSGVVAWMKQPEPYMVGFKI